MLCLILVALYYSSPLARARTPVLFSKVEASFHSGKPSRLKDTINGQSDSSTGWSVGGNFKSPQWIIFTAENPIQADFIELSLHFMSGRPHASFASFSLSYTTDETPSQDGSWEPLPLLNFSAATSKLTKHEGDRLMAEEVSYTITGLIPDEIYRISTRFPGVSVTGFRINTFPVLRSIPHFDKTIELPNVPIMAWAQDGNFVLTEFRAEVISTSTNVALGCPVTATHPLYSTYRKLEKAMLPGALTDGWPSTLAHPNKGTPTEDFYFEIDLGKQRQIDHLGLRQRGDIHGLKRFGKMWIKIYEENPQSGAPPSWQIFNRPDGSFPPMGAVDILRAKDGEGKFRGRYIRISSENESTQAPMLAELEVYETRTPHLVSVMVDEQKLETEDPLSIPPDVQRISFHLDIPQIGRPFDTLYRWRLRGSDRDWQHANSLELEIPCPPAGAFELELQAAHSDGTWDSSIMTLPFSVKARFTQTPAFLWLLGCMTLLLGIASSYYFGQLKIKRLKAQTALSDERSRIARNMHDDVGARLAQLTVLHDVFSMEHELPPAAHKDLTSLSGFTRDAINALDEAVWTVNPRNDKLPALATYLIQYIDSYLAPLGVTYRVDSPNTWPNIPLRAGTRHEVALAFKESLQNIIKHAEATEVMVSLRYEDKQFIISVADNGRGFTHQSSIPGQDGLRNMDQRLKSVNGTCYWSTNETGGTTVEMKLTLS